MTEEQLPLHAILVDQNTMIIVRGDDDTDPEAVLECGRIGPMFNVQEDETTIKSAYWRGVIEGLKHAHNVMSYQNVFGVNEKP